MKILTTATLLLASGLSLPVHAQEVSEDDAAWAMDFAMHDAVFTMYHEIGHMLVGELSLPVLGKEEDAADSLATILLLTDEEDDDAYEALIDSADGWYFNAVNSTGSGVDDFSYYDEHSLDIQRAYAMVCMMVGKDPDAFAETADEYGLEAEQQENCAYTFDQAITSWAVVLEQHEVTDARGADISVVYEEAGDFNEFANELEARQVLERAADLIMASYVLPRPVTFRATQCGQANAFYSPGDSEVIYCYELAEEMFRLYINDILPAYQ